ncbi:ParB N-terminal domain-containing protein [Aureimonas sp. Leaf324]|uniref:ParB N-terminal domain-containing protein n=1 Tax=Aureimonas sp. Leaf324 TaxID=1736336 RepID=UPI0006F6AAFB|nr:hypothetical protein ASF65_04765 [Aureimonas sp. Leaf324]
MSVMRQIPIAMIDAGNRLRVLDPAWVRTLADDMAVGGQEEPIRVVERGDRFQLVSGARRLAAAALLAWDEIEAKVKPAGALPDEASARLAEIKADMMRGEPTVLDRARYIAAWRAVYETVHAPAKPGRKPKPRTPQEADELSAKFALNFSDAAQEALQISRRSLFLALKVATIPDETARCIALHPIARKQSELLMLADLAQPRQVAVVEMLTAEPARADSVSTAIMLLSGGAGVVEKANYERFQERFVAWKPAERHAFFELNAAEFEEWLAMRRASTRIAPALKAVG